MKKNCMKRNSTNMLGLEMLRNAVVEQAVKDYRHEYKVLKRNPNNDHARHEMEQIEKFFLSDYFKVFTDLDGERLLSRVKEISENEGKSNSRNKQK